MMVDQRSARPVRGGRKRLKVPGPPPIGIRERVRRLRARFVFQREMKLRLISAAILIPVVLGALWLHEVAFAGIVLVTALLVQDEWLRMVGASTPPVVLTAFCVLAAVTVATATQPAYVGLLTLALGAALTGLVAGGRGLAGRWTGAGVLYAGAAIIALVTLRKGADGVGAVVFVLLIAWTTDTMAFFVGRKLGGPRLWRRVSPSKTWSGALGGLAFGTVCGAAVLAVLQVPSSFAAFAVAALVAAAAIGGDLLESAAKRRFSIKDAGSIIPGHGGVMDRVDGLIAASVVTMVLGTIAALEHPASGFLSLMGRA